MQATGNNLNFDITNIYRTVNNPIWTFVVFQTDRSNNQQKDNLFDHVNVKNLRINLGGKCYPEESLNLNFDNNYYCLAYIAFQDFRKFFIKTDSIPYFGKKDFKNLYPICSVDLSDQSQIYHM